MAHPGEYLFVPDPNKEVVCRGSDPNDSTIAKGDKTFPSRAPYEFTIRIQFRNEDFVIAVVNDCDCIIGIRIKVD